MREYRRFVEKEDIFLNRRGRNKGVIFLLEEMSEGNCRARKALSTSRTWSIDMSEKGWN